MGELVLNGKNHKQIQLLSWVLIILSGFLMLRTIFAMHGYRSIITMQSITRNFNPPVEINFTLYFVQASVELLLCVLIFVSATFVLKYKNTWRQVLIYGLLASIMFLAVSPLADYYNMSKITVRAFTGDEREILHANKAVLLYWSYTWSIIFSSFFMYVIMKFSKSEVKSLFR